METKTYSPLESRHSLVEPGTPPTAEMRVLLDDIQVCISVARRQEHEAMQQPARITRLEIEIQSPQESGFSPDTAGFQKLLLAESSESTRLKARISGLWNQDFAEFAENKISLAELAEAPKLIN